jgi:hypothetical protein
MHFTGQMGEGWNYGRKIPILRHYKHRKTKRQYAYLDQTSTFLAKTVDFMTTQSQTTLSHKDILP